MTSAGPLTKPRSPHWPDGVERQIFISYRKALSETDARLLFTHLDHRFPGEVFWDRRSLPGGRDWEDELERALEAPGLRVVVFIVAQGIWEHSSPGHSTPRLWDVAEPGDVVLRELEIALDRRDKEEDLFELILAPETRECTMPMAEIVRPGIPERTQRLLERIARIHMDTEHELRTMSGLNALVEHVERRVRELGARSNADIRTWADVEEKRGPNSKVLLDGLERLFDAGHRDTRLIAQLTALMVVDGKYAEARDRLRDHRRRESRETVTTGGEHDAHERYWRAFAALALARAELRGEGARRLPSLRLARELATAVLLPALEALDQLAGELATIVLPTERDGLRRSDALALHREVAGALDEIWTDYFEAKGIKVSADPWAEDSLPLEERLASRIWRQLRCLEVEGEPRHVPRELQAGPAAYDTGPSTSERNVWQ